MSVVSEVMAAETKHNSVFADLKKILSVKREPAGVPQEEMQCKQKAESFATLRCQLIGLDVI
jgi:hypothetical protein